MKKLLPLVAVLATVISGCWTGGAGSGALEKQKDIKPVPVEEAAFKPAPVKAAAPVNAQDITQENPKVMLERLTSEINGDL